MLYPIFKIKIKSIYSRRLVILFLTLILSITYGVGHGLGVDRKTNEPINSLDLSYKAAKDYYYLLERDLELGNDRNNWLKGVRKFRKLYLADFKNELAPSCLYMMAKIHHRMFTRFHLPIDLDEAINYYNDVALLFPMSSLADDALFKNGEIFQQEKNDPKQAIKMYQKMVNKFPDGDKTAQALSRIKQLSEKNNIKLPESFAYSGFSKKLVNVLPVKYWSSDDYTRIVIRASAPVQYNSNLLEQNENLPRRLYIDFAQSYIPPRYRSPIPIQDGLLKQVRTGQFDPSTVRVVLDIETISNYKIFNLNDPFRVVVDVHGQKKEKEDNTPTLSKTLPNAKEPNSSAVNKKQDSKTYVNTKERSTVSVIQSETATSSSSPIINLKDTKKIKPGVVAANKKITDPRDLSLAQQLGLGVKKVVIDPGHGGKDPGAMAFGLKEKDIVLAVAKKVANKLRTQYGYEVILTRSDDTFLPLEERIAIANTKKADLFVSIHVNAHPTQSVHGIETFYLNLATNAEAMRVAARENATSTHNISDLQDILSDLMQNSKIKESSRLAEFVNTSMISGLESSYQTKNLGVKQAPFYVLIGAEMPAVLTEISFITNPGESNLLKKDEYIEKLGFNIADGVADYADYQTTASMRL